MYKSSKEDTSSKRGHRYCLQVKIKIITLNKNNILSFFVVENILLKDIRCFCGQVLDGTVSIYTMPVDLFVFHRGRNSNSIHSCSGEK